MSPTNFCPGASAVKSRPIRSGVAGSPSGSAIVVRLYARGWTATRYWRRINSATVFTQHGCPRSLSTRVIRRAPYVSWNSSNTSITSTASCARRVGGVEPASARWTQS